MPPPFIPEPYQIEGHKREFMQETYAVEAGTEICFARLSNIYCDVDDGDACTLTYEGKTIGFSPSSPTRTFTHDDIMGLIRSTSDVTGSRLDMSLICSLSHAVPEDCIPFLDRHGAMWASHKVYLTYYNIVCRFPDGSWSLVFSR